MPGYTLPREHGPAVRDGRQRITLSAPRDNSVPGGHAAIGDDVFIDLAKRGDKARERVARRRCILRAQLVITEDALVRITDLRFRDRDEWAAEAERLKRLIEAAERGTPAATAETLLALAKLAGFRSWKALYTFHAATARRGRPDAEGRVVRELIGWSTD